MSAKALPDKAWPICRLLVVETSAADLSAWRQKLNTRGVQVEVAGDWTQAWRVVRERMPDMVLAGPRLDQINPDCFARKADYTADLPAVLSELGSLHQAEDTKQFLAHLAAAAGKLITPLETFAVSCDSVAGEPDLDSLQTHLAGQLDLAAIFRRHFDPHGPSAGPGPVLADRAADADRRFWMIPVAHNARFEALVGVVSRGAAGLPAPERLVMVRLLARMSGSMLAALRNTDKQRRRVEDLEALLQIRSHWIANMCHEFRSLLAAVRGYSRRVADGRAGLINEQQRDHLSVILRNTEKLLDLVSYSVPFVAEQQFRLERLDLREAWWRALKRARRRADEESVRITEQIPDQPFLVVADRDRMEVMFDILLASALGCVASGGEVASQFLRGANREVTARLFATGEGLPSELAEKAFQHTDEGAPPEKRTAGLPLVHDIVWSHGGRISLTTNSGEGTLFTLTLPPAPSGQGEEASAAAGRGPLRLPSEGSGAR